MFSQIDPLTGLPMVFGNIIEQIPLGKQIFPYTDLGATQGPTAQPLYPDSIIPVSAFLSGQHPDTGSAQTVETDGQHNLNVHVKASDAGGGSFTGKTFTPIYILNRSRPAGSIDDDFTLSGVDDTYYLIGAQASCSVDPNGTVPAKGQCSFQVGLYFIPLFTNMWLCTGSFAWGVPSASSGSISAIATWTPPTPIQIPIFTPPGDRHFELDAQSDADIIYSMGLYFCQKQ